MNIFATFLGSTVLWDQKVWSIEDAHDSRVCIRTHDHSTEILRQTLDPHRIVTEFEAGRMKWAHVNVNHRMVG